MLILAIYFLFESTVFIIIAAVTAQLESFFYTLSGQSRVKRLMRLGSMWPRLRFEFSSHKYTRTEVY